MEYLSDLLHVELVAVAAEVAEKLQLLLQLGHEVHPQILGRQALIKPYDVPERHEFVGTLAVLDV